MKWEEKPLGEVLCPHDDWVNIEPEKTYREVTVRLWGKGADLRRECLGAEIGAPTRNRVKSGQFIISKIDARNGAFALVPEFLDGAVVTSDFPTFEVNPDHALPGFVGWLSKTESFVDLCRRASEGTTNRVRLKLERFLTTRIPLPPVAEQRQIVAKLDAAAARIARIENAQSANAGDFDRVLLTEFHLITINAPRRPMGEVAPLVRRPVKIEDDKEYPELGVRSFGRGTFHKPSLTAVELGDKRIFWIKPGDLVFNIVFAWEGAIAIASKDDDGRVGSHRFLTCVVQTEITTVNFLQFYFLTEEGLKTLGEASPGGAGRNRTLGITAQEAIQVPIPPLAHQQAFDALCRKFARLRAAQDSRAADLAALMPSLLDRAFKGEL
jgi:type I restriction enzyme S subunit